MNNRALSCASYHDLSEEQHYHNLLLGALSVNAYNEYEVKSNNLVAKTCDLLFLSYESGFCDSKSSERESGLGRPDIMVTKRGKAPEFDETYVFEVKYAKEENEKEGKLKEARNQILNKKYSDTIKGKIHLVAVVAFDKSYTFEIFQ